MIKNKRMVNYENSCVYKICCLNTEIKGCYVGSTTNFRRRKNNHKSICNNEKSKDYNLYVYRFIRDTGGWENWDVVLVEEVNCKDIKELHKKEREWVEKLKATLNTQIPNRSPKEYDKEYVKKNKEKINEKRRERYEKNKEKINEKKKEKITCECGSIIRKSDLARHKKSGKHLEYLKKN